MRDRIVERTARARQAPALWSRRVSLGAALVAASIAGIPSASAQNSGKQIFQQTCAACHSIGAGKLVGPDLAGVTDKRPEEWLLRFIKSSQALVKAGDPVAVALFAEFNKIPMPDQALTDDQVRTVLAYIKEAGGGGAAARAQAESHPYFLPTLLISIAALIVLTIVALRAGYKKTAA